MYVKAHLDLSLRSLFSFCCFLARAPRSLARGFLVAVAGRALFVGWVFVETSVVLVLSEVSRSHLHNGSCPNCTLRMGKL